jgi:hypothetical protein
LHATHFKEDRVSNRDNRHDSIDARLERAKDTALGSHDSNPSHLDEAGEAAGGIGGAVLGAAVGSAAGPIGTLIGGVAGALGGWWTGRAATEAGEVLSASDDEYYRADYEDSPHKLADRAFEDVRPAYYLGHVAAQNPEYANRTWSDVSNELRRAWTVGNSRKYGDWSTVRDYAGSGFTRGRVDRDVDRMSSADDALYDRDSRK